MEDIGGAVFTAQDFRDFGELAVEAWRSGIDRDWSAKAGTLEWICRRTEWIRLLRSCWAGRPDAFDGEHYQQPAGVVCEPTSARPVPVLVGGTTPAALRRARDHG